MGMDAEFRKISQDFSGLTDLSNVLFLCFAAEVTSLLDL